MKIRHKRYLKWLMAGIGSMLILIVVLNALVVFNASGKTYDGVDDIPENRVGLILATSPVTPLGAHNFYFDNRIKAADELYKAGKVDYFIASGGDYRSSQKIGCDEPAAIRDSLVARGVPADRIILDYEGTDTRHSIQKAKQVYGLDHITIISQKGHNERALYWAKHCGIDAVAYNAKPSHIRRNRIKNNLREYFARVKMFWTMANQNHHSYSEPSSLPWNNVRDPLSFNLGEVKGHNEQDTIVGNFTGLGIDTLYVYEVENEKVEDAYERIKYYARSNNPKIKDIEIYGAGLWGGPRLVFEGDVDGDGKDEWGYMHVWINSQWRQYRIFNWDSKRKKWRFLYYGDLLDTPEYVRESGVDLVEVGPEPGLIKINWGDLNTGLCDTIVKPTYTQISKDAW